MPPSSSQLLAREVFVLFRPRVRATGKSSALSAARSLPRPVRRSVIPSDSPAERSTVRPFDQANDLAVGFGIRRKRGGIEVEKQLQGKASISI